MPSFTATHSRPDEGIATHFLNASTGNEGHDYERISENLDGQLSAMPSSSFPGKDDVEIEITAGQKMLSAMSGSLLTSLIGISSP
jgi:solute carrier family 25 protein 39/40